MLPVRITYDETANAAYLYLRPDSEARVAKCYPCDPIEVGGMINLDLDDDGRLIGVEVLDARAKLAPELIAAAEDITRRGSAER